MSHRTRLSNSFAPWKRGAEINRGGNGTVYWASHPDGRRGVIKVLRRIDDGESYSRFSDEIKVVTSLGDFPGIVPIWDSHLPERPVDNDKPWFVMPEAEALERHLAADSSLAHTVGAIEGIAATLAELHERSEPIAHRDIKPANLYWYAGRAALGDFGLAHFPQRQG